MTPDDQDRDWFLAQLKPNCANIAQRNLSRQGFETFLPLEKATKARGRKFVSVMRPLFPGYMFVAFDMKQGHWHAINSTYGVSRLVSFGDKPREVPRGLVRQLQMRCEDDIFNVPKPTFQAGDAVTMTNGPFANFAAEVEKMTPNERVWVLIDLMGRQTRLVVGQNEILAVSDK